MKRFVGDCSSPCKACGRMSSLASGRALKEGSPMLDAAELEQISEIWGLQFAEALIADRRWPTCDQPRAIRAAGVIVERAICEIVATLNTGDDFRPFTEMMAVTISGAFWNSMPKGFAPGRSAA
jgi:hypothetical protein